MFIDEKAPGEVKPSMKMSEAIVLGSQMIPEGHSSYAFCALGTAYFAVTQRYLGTFSDHTFWSPIDAIRDAVSKTFNVPVSVVAAADRLHRGGMPRLEVAEYLRKQGY